MEVIIWEEWRRGGHKLTIRLAKLTVDLEPWLGPYRAGVESYHGIECTSVATTTVAAFLGDRDTCTDKG